VASPVVLLHGFTQTGASWERVAAMLPERYRALAPDIRGHGAASDVEPVTLEGVIEDVRGVVSGPFVLAGYSMGGRIGLHAALALGDRVERLVLIGASPGIADESERAQRRTDDERLACEIESTEIEAFASRWARTPVLAGQRPEVAATAHADRLRNTPAGLARALRGLGTGALPSLWERLGEARTPVTLVVGERDQKFRAVAREMAERLPLASVVVVPGAGHAVHLENPRAVAGVISGS
jgi:2-succinyl-6-hydroxy-2,4-cyclohexadiene-1-carboxylate synthase